MMTDRLATNDDASSWPADLSALMDGECSPAEVQALCRRWADDPVAQQDWHAYHLMGDVLRSDELAGDSGDAAFLARLQQRLAEEPVVLAPLPAEAPVRRRSMRRWSAPLGAAAGVALVAGAVWVMRPQVTDRAAYSQLAGAGPNGTAAAGNAVAATQFERYLSAHKQFQPAAVVSPTNGYVRSAVYEANDR